MTTDRADAILEVLADPTRRRVVRLLGERPLRAGDLARATGVSPPVISRHLKILLGAGVVSDERVPGDARLRVFRLRREPLLALREWLDELQAQWTEQLGAFKRHVDKRQTTGGQR